MRPLALLLASLLLAGCATMPAGEDAPPTASSELRVGAALLHHGGVKGGLSLLHLAEGADSVSVAFPDGVLVLDDAGMLAPATEPVTLAQGDALQFLPPYGLAALAIRVDGAPVTVPLEEGEAFVSGERVVELLKVQRDRFPHRTPGFENYTLAVAYFADFFDALGYDVEVFRPPLLPDVQLPVGSQPGTQSTVSVVAIKRGTTQPDRYLAFGGHFDVVEQVTHGAFDNTGGTVATLAMAEALSRVETSHSIVFAAWGGEEDGILGSQAWLSAHPELVPAIDLYVNFDVTGLAWPAPLSAPAPVVVSTGPDGPAQDALAAQHAEVAKTWLAVEAPFVYEGVAQGQATGAGVNAQSDHTSFMARGIPVVFQFTSDVGGALNLIHKEADTVENMTAYALLGPEGIGQELTPEEVAAGERALADSFETQTMGALYLALLQDGGTFPSARAEAPLSPLLVKARP